MKKEFNDFVVARYPRCRGFVYVHVVASRDEMVAGGDQRKRDNHLQLRRNVLTAARPWFQVGPKYLDHMPNAIVPDAESLLQLELVEHAERIKAVTEHAFIA